MVVPSEDISPWLKHAIVAVEDKRFYEHRGVDLRGHPAGRLGGHHEPRHGAGRLDDHAAVRQEHDQRRTRRRSRASCARRRSRGGSSRCGRRTRSSPPTSTRSTSATAPTASSRPAASTSATSADMADINPAEAALLAGIPENPTLYDPVAHPKVARARRNLVLRQMLAAALPDAVPVPPLTARGRCRTRARSGSPASHGQAAPYFANYVTDQLVSDPKYGKKVFGGGYRVTTTIDLGCRRSRATRSRRCYRRRSGRRRRSSRSTRTPGTSSRWSAAGTTTRASSTSRRRASASPARPSSRSCSRRRSRRGSRRRRRSTRSR